MNRLLRILSIIVFPALLHAQISEGGLAPSQRPDLAFAFRAAGGSNISIPAPDMARVHREDAENADFRRFAVARPADLDMGKDGSWISLPSGERVWRCTIQSEGAKGLVLIFDRFKLPEGVRFYAHNSRRSFGAYTAASCTPDGNFLIGVLPGETATLECLLPPGMALEAVSVHLSRVDYAYDKNALGEFDPAAVLDFGEAQPCNININCTQGADWQVQKKSVARILMVFESASAWCTGALVANTSNTFEPNFLTAHHCQIITIVPLFNLWRFDFDYEASGCSNPATEPVPKSVLGCERLAFRQETDFMLLKLNPIPATYGVYFAGWSRVSNPAPGRTAFIHHPVGDIKKISIDTAAAVIHPQTINWGAQFGTSPVNSHWATDPDFGIFQPGSSGCPLFDTNKRIIGQLHGGLIAQNNACNILAAYFGRFDLSWNQGTTPNTRLREWLDPMGSNKNTQDGYTQPIPTTTSISGNVKTVDGVNMRNIEVRLAGGLSATVRTDTAGNYTFTNVPLGANYTVTPVRDTNDINGVTTFDLLLISKHILGIESLNTPWKILAADINRSSSITTLDIVEGRKLVLNVTTAFENSNSWRFVPAFVSFSNPSNPFQPSVPPEAITINNLSGPYANANFVGLKVGDLNGNSNPQH